MNQQEVIRGDWNVETWQQHHWVVIMRGVTYEIAKRAVDQIAPAQQTRYRIHYVNQPGTELAYPA
ncbi:hypothetical protein [Furfurilactobacillus curtus]|uniref:DUF2188 domain-containing protein n=1 Tax=Furfurilactobacillus curtus TaxID=1746200 RepID=A0ABQ5JKC9_9LACO